MTTTSKLCFIGAGHMGASLVHGLIQQNYPVDKLIVCDTHADNLTPFEQLNIETHSDPIACLSTAETVIFCIKPQNIKALLETLGPKLAETQPLLISICAGVSTAFIQSQLSQPMAIIRAMPNTPAMISLGATGLFANTLASPKDKTVAEQIFNAAGVFTWLNTEAQINVITALSGSGPAYHYVFMQMLAEIANEYGLDLDVAEGFSVQTSLGAATLAKTQSASLTQLRDNVTSKGGTTEAALKRLNTDNLRSILRDTMNAAIVRAEDIEENLC